MENGLLLPIIYIVEFIVIVPIYMLFLRKFNGFGKGEFDFCYFSTLLFLILLFQFTLL